MFVALQINDHYLIGPSRAVRLGTYAKYVLEVYDTVCSAAARVDMAEEEVRDVVLSFPEWQVSRL